MADLTLYKSVTDTANWQRREVARLSDLRDLVTSARAAEKIHLPLFGGYTLRDGTARGNENVEAVTAIVGDYDGGEVSAFDASIMLEDAGVAGLIYTSPSWTAEAPKWRVVCLLSEDVTPNQHQRLVSRLNGVFGGILAPESWTLSQPYFFGATGDKTVHTFPIDGEFLDQLPELDARAIHKPGGGGGDYGGPISSGRIAHRKEDISIMRTPAVTMTIERVAKYLDRLPNDGPPDWNAFNRLGMCIYNATGGSDEGFRAFDAWASQNPAYDAGEVAARWRHWVRSPAGHLDARNLGKICEDMGGTPPPPPPPGGGAQAGAGQNGQSYTSPPPGGEHQDKIEIPLALEYWDDESDAEPPFDFVEDTLTDGSMAVVYGDSNVGKTFWMVDLAVHVALGRPWQGHDVEQGGVVYIAAEGGGGMRKRRDAIRKKLHIYKAPLAFITAPVDLLDPAADRGRVVEAVKKAAEQFDTPVRMIVVDTLSRAMAGGNENAPDDMTAFIGNVDYLRAETGACVAIVHHTGKDQAKGMRGHSSLRAATDTEIELKKISDGVGVANVTKQRDLEPWSAQGYRLVPVPVGTSSRGKPVTSCVVEPTGDLKQAEAPAVKPGSRPFALLEIIHKVFAGRDENVRAPEVWDISGGTVRVSDTCPDAELRRFFVNEVYGAPGTSLDTKSDTWDRERDSANKAYKRSRTTLINNGFILMNDQKIALVEGVT